MPLLAVCKVYAVWARWRLDHRGPKAPGAGPAGGRGEIRAAGVVCGWSLLSCGSVCGRCGGGAQAWLAGGTAGLHVQGPGPRGAGWMSSSWRRWMRCWMPGRWPRGTRTSGGRWPASATWSPASSGCSPVPGIWYLLRRRGWTCPAGARRAIERDDGAIEVWKTQTWGQIKGQRRLSAAGSSSKTSPASR